MFAGWARVSCVSFGLHWSRETQLSWSVGLSCFSVAFFLYIFGLIRVKSICKPQIFSENRPIEVLTVKFLHNFNQFALWHWLKKVFLVQTWPTSPLETCCRHSKSVRISLYVCAIHRMKMLNRNQKHRFEMEEKAEIIGSKLKRLQRKCASEAEKVCCFVNVIANSVHSNSTQ